MRIAGTVDRAIRVFFTILPLLLIRGMLAQTSSVPYAHFFGFSLQNVFPKYVYQGRHPSIREVDFQNMTLIAFDGKGRPYMRFHLKNGSCKTEDHPGHSSIEIKSMYYLASEKASRQYVLVLWNLASVSGSSSQDGFAQVFDLFGNRLEVTQQLTWDNHFDADGPYYIFDEKTNTLIVRTAHYIPGDAHCCVSAMDIVTLRWNGNQFVQTALRTELSEYGKREGKKL